MSDSISRQAAIEAVYEALRTPLPCYGNNLLQDSMTLAEAIVKNIPSAEPERKKGNWIVKEEDWRKQLEWDECSECGFVTTRQYNFCPNCGADMW